MINLFPKAQTKPIGVSSCYYPDDTRLQGIELERWQHIPIGGNWENLPKRLINGKAKYSNFHRKLQPDKPSYTLGKEEHFSSGRFYHWSEARRINNIELQRIGSYPDAYIFIGDNKLVHNHIGNSVPPLFMRAIAHQIGVIMFGFPAMTSHAPITNYVQFLDEAWQQHLAPRGECAPTVVSLFAGCGGSSLGYSMAGYRELLAVEWDDNAVETFKLNFPDIPVYHGDIAKLSVEECLALTGLEVGELDILDGSPPCQGFSTAGKRVIDDPRNQLFQEYVRLLRGLKPKVFVMENVSGMVKGKMKLIFAEIMRELKASGYKVSARLLNAMYFGVPQSRQRMIFIGVREDLGIEPSHPKAQSKPIVSREALIDIDLDCMGEYRANPSAQKVKSYLARIPIGKNASYLTGSTGFNLGKLHPDKPAPTIVKHVSLTGQFSGLVHYDDPRLLAISEIKRLASYPDDYQFIGKFETQWMRIGNSVPPMFMKAIADHIWLNILQPSKLPI